MAGRLLLELVDVYAQYRQRIGRRVRIVKAVSGVSLSIREGEIIGVVGESGCGKSTLASIMMMSVRPPLEFVGGEVRLHTREGSVLNLERMGEEELRSRVWGREIALIPQAAMNALMPTLKIKRIVYDVLRSHDPSVTMREAVELARERFGAVGLPERVLEMYPFELSGGMRQRAVIATAILLNPRLLIADEPTSALDVVTQKTVLKTFYDIYRRGLIKSIVFISHDIATVRQIATRMIVMYAGKIVEDAPTEELVRNPLHPYTEGLLRAVMTPEKEVKKRRLEPIPGQPPDLANPPPGCRFHPRCRYAKPRCRSEEPPLVEVGGGRRVACWMYRGGGA